MAAVPDLEKKNCANMLFSSNQVLLEAVDCLQKNVCAYGFRLAIM